MFQNKSTFTFLILLITTLSFAQKGYLGKIHEISVDPSEMVLNGEYGIDYKLSIATNFAISTSIKLIHANREKTIIKDEYSLFRPNILGDFNESEIPNSYNVSGRSVSINLLFNNRKSGMSFPLGFYQGIGYENYKTNFTEYMKDYSLNTTSNSNQIPTNTAQLDTFNYSYISHRVRYIWGNTMYLKKDFVFSFGIEAGVKWGTVKSKDAKSSNRQPYKVYPGGRILKERNSILESTISPTTGETVQSTWRGMKVLFTPFFRFGYLF